MSSASIWFVSRRSSICTLLVAVALAHVPAGAEALAAGSPAAAGRCTGAATLKQGSRSKIGFQVRCERPVDGFVLGVFLSGRKPAAGEQPLVLSYRRHLRRGSSAWESKACTRRSGAAIECEVGSSDPTVWVGELSVRKGQRCRRPLWLRQTPFVSDDPSDPPPPPSLRWYTLFRDKPADCP